MRSRRSLTANGRAVAPLDVADDRRARRTGLLGRDGFDGAMWFPRTGWIHTLGMRFALDVAWCRRDGSVLRVQTVPTNRLTRPVLQARVIVEAAAGSFETWGIDVGTTLAVAEHPGTAT